MDGEHVPEMRKFLDDLTDEFEEGTTGDSFMCAGPKSYALQLVKSNGAIDHILKAKGLPLNKTTARIINIETMLKIVLNKIDRDAGEDERELLMGNEMYYKGLRGRDVSAIAIEQMKNFQGKQT